MARKAKESVRPQAFVETLDRASRLEKVAARFRGFEPAAKVLENVRSVPTIFPSLDRVLRTGGFPLKRVVLVHGPSNQGKSQFKHGLGLSYLMRGHFYANIDAEMTDQIGWAEELMGSQYANSPAFVAMRPKTYEQTIDAVRNFCEEICKARRDGDISDDTGALIAVDSIRKLVPKRLLDVMLKAIEEEGGEEKAGKKSAKGKGVDGMNGRGAMYKAALNSQWMDEIVPLINQANVTFLIIAREYENPDADMWAEDFKLSGGKALFFESGIAMRVMHSKWIKEGSDPSSRLIGEEHRLQIRKTKIGGKSEKMPEAFFSTSNGEVFPYGFDRWRDLIEHALELGVLVQKGGGSIMVAATGEVLGRGRIDACRELRANETLFNEIDGACRTMPHESEKNDASDS